jgi:prepilin-type N-terminal cleavage/methylation domain-containing protein
MPQRPATAGFTLLELLIAVVIAAILATLLIPNENSGTPECLDAMARVVAGDLAYARALAVSNNSQYRFTWDTVNNQYILQYSGTNPALSTLPNSVFSSPTDPPNQRTVALASLPHMGVVVQLVGAAASVGTTQQAVTTLEFGPLGGTTSSAPTTIWLSAGTGTNIRYITLAVNPATGLVTIGPYTAVGPPSGLFGP